VYCTILRWVFGATVTVPSVFTVNGPFGVEVITTSAGLTAVPFNVSLSKTLIPRLLPPLIGPATSSIASMVFQPYRYFCITVCWV
jgi:hypothetical protein